VPIHTIRGRRATAVPTRDQMPTLATPAEPYDGFAGQKIHRPQMTSRARHQGDHGEQPDDDADGAGWPESFGGVDGGQQQHQQADRDGRGASDSRALSRMDYNVKILTPCIGGGGSGRTPLGKAAQPCVRGTGLLRLRPTGGRHRREAGGAARGRSGSGTACGRRGSVWEGWTEEGSASTRAGSLARWPRSYLTRACACSGTGLWQKRAPARLPGTTRTVAVSTKIAAWYKAGAPLE